MTDILKHDNKLWYLLNLADSALWKCVSMYVHSKGGMWMPGHKTLALAVSPLSSLQNVEKKNALWFWVWSQVPETLNQDTEKK